MSRRSFCIALMQSGSLFVTGFGNFSQAFSAVCVRVGGCTASFVGLGISLLRVMLRVMHAFYVIEVALLVYRC